MDRFASKIKTEAIMISNNRRQILLATAASAIAPWSNGQSTYPNKPIRLIVPVAAGGGANND